MRIELLNDMYLEAKKGGGYELFKRYTTAKGEPRRKRIAYAGDLEQAVKAFLQAVQYEELKELPGLPEQTQMVGRVTEKIERVVRFTSRTAHTERGKL